MRCRIGALRPVEGDPADTLVELDGAVNFEALRYSAFVCVRARYFQTLASVEAWRETNSPSASSLNSMGSEL